MGGDLTSVKCNGEWLHLGLTVDDTNGLVLSVDELAAEDAETIKAWLEPIAEAVSAQLLVSDDADAFKTVADELGLDHQVCKGHVKRNTETFIENLMAYATGRRVEYFDMPTVRAIERSAMANEYRMSSFIAGVVNSPAFRMSKPSEAVTEDAPMDDEGP